MKKVSRKFLPLVLRNITKKNSFFTRINVDPEFTRELWSYWDEGSKSEYVGFDGEKIVPVNKGNAPRWFGGVAIPQKFGKNLALISFGTTRGESSSLRLECTLEFALKMCKLEIPTGTLPDALPGAIADELEESGKDVYLFRNMFVE